MGPANRSGETMCILSVPPGRKRLSAFQLGAAAFGALLLWGSSVRAADQEAVNRAVERGVEYLRRLPLGNGLWPHPGHAEPAESALGATALAGLTLLECDVPAKDALVQRAARAVRESSVSMTRTYTLSLSILFLDRLGDPADIPLIESMAVRLLGGQNSLGGWTYTCPAIPESEIGRLTALLGQRSELVGRAEPPKPSPEGKRPARVLSKEIRAQLDVLERARPAEPQYPLDDNSNTQFATLALWVSHRHGVPIERALERIDARFRQSQQANGGWAYYYPGTPLSASASMTCAGLLGLAYAHGLAREKAVPGKAVPDPGKDKSIQAALLALGTVLGVAPAKAASSTLAPRLAEGNRAYYFLWSLERAAVAFGLKTIGKKDWYDWGAAVLLANQAEDGGWHGEYDGGGADTCFALLFLKRANLASDLTTVLTGKVPDPGESTLRATVDIKELTGKGPGLKSPIERDAAAASGSPAKPKRKPAPKAGADEVAVQSARLSTDLADAPRDKQDRLIEEYGDKKGLVYTLALADAIPQLTGEAKTKAREALAQRLARLTAESLADKLADEDLEVRRAAALASAMKGDRANLAKLIDLLQDPEPPVARAAIAALKSLTKQDFGPSPDASRAEQAAAVDAWKDWLKKQRDN